jgi:hypothetical protein
MSLSEIPTMNVSSRVSILIYRTYALGRQSYRAMSR